MTFACLHYEVGSIFFSGVCACTYCAKILSAFVKIVHPLVSLPQLKEGLLMPECVT